MVKYFRVGRSFDLGFYGLFKKKTTGARVRTGWHRTLHTT